MIDNPNPRNFYTQEEMSEREKYIPRAKSLLLAKIQDLQQKIESEEPFPHGNQDLDFLVETDDVLDRILGIWSY